MPPLQTLVLSAWEPEVAPLRRLLRGTPAARDVALEAIGVGTVDAAVGATQALARARPRRVLFVGTAGVYPGAAARALPIGAAVVAGELRLVSTATLRGDAYHPAPLVATAAPTAALGARLARAAGGTAPVIVACPLAITHTAALARRLAGTGAALENLEAFAVARAAVAARVPFAAVLGVSNVVGPKAHAEWRANHLAASRAACHIVWSLLRAGRVRY